MCTLKAKPFFIQTSLQLAGLTSSEFAAVPILRAFKTTIAAWVRSTNSTIAKMTVPSDVHIKAGLGRRSSTTIDIVFRTQFATAVSARAVAAMSAYIASSNTTSDSFVAQFAASLHVGGVTDIPTSALAASAVSSTAGPTDSSVASNTLDEAAAFVLDYGPYVAGLLCCWCMACSTYYCCGEPIEHEPAGSGKI